jgi:hypothetical protein
MAVATTVTTAAARSAGSVRGTAEATITVPIPAAAGTARTTGTTGTTGAGAEPTAVTKAATAATESAVASTPEAAAEAASEPTAETAGTHGSGHGRLGVAATSEATSQAAGLPPFDGSTPLNVNLDTAVLDADTVTSIQSSYSRTRQMRSCQ